VPSCRADASAQLYRSHAYYAAKVAATMPFNMLASFVFSFIVYGMAGLRPGAKHIWQNGVLNTLLSLISVQVSSQQSAAASSRAAVPAQCLCTCC
jgi:hypothetical protein